MQIQLQNYNITFGTKYAKIPKQELKSHLQAGYSYREIAEMYGITREAVSRCKNWYGLKSQKTTTREQNIKQVTALYQQGMTPLEIKKELCIPIERVKKIIEKFSKQETVEEQDPILTKIAAKLNLSKEDLKKYLK